MKKCLSLFLTLLTSAALAQEIVYNVSFPNLIHHEAVISLEISSPPQGEVRIHMSQSSPGRYANHQFGKNVYKVMVRDENDRTLSTRRVEPEVWAFTSPGKGNITVSYILFADRTDGTYSEIDEHHAHLNMPATFMWVEGMEDRPIKLEFELPQNSTWRAATQLVETESPHVFTAPNLQYFMDSPVKLGVHQVRTWKVNDEQNNEAEIRLVVHHDGEESEVETLAVLTKRVVEEQIKIWGELPKFDHGVYSFLADYRKGNYGDGMEHRNSTILTSGLNLKENEYKVIGTISHEFFHAWNVERLRPRSIEPFDFSRPNVCPELWFAEGFTSYYGNLSLKRAGILTLDKYLESMGSTFNRVLNSPGTYLHSPVEMSEMAPFVDAARSVDPTNKGNVFTSYYSYGAIVALALDLQLRVGYGLDLDGYMRLLWDKFGRDEKPYTMNDLLVSLQEYTGDKAFADSFFANHVFGNKLSNFAQLLGSAGISVRLIDPSAWMGEAELIEGPEGMRVRDYPQKGDPYYEAGLEKDDIILSFDDKTYLKKEKLNKYLDTKETWQTLELVVKRGSITFPTTLTLKPNPKVTFQAFESGGSQLSADAKSFRESWLGGEDTELRMVESEDGN